MTTGADIARAAADWRGVPWRHLGRDRNGVDCVGLGICVFRELGLLAPDFDVASYSRTPNSHAFIRHLEAAGLVRHGGPRRPGMLCTLRYGREPMHLAVVGTDSATLIHADSTFQVVVVHPLDTKWRRRVTSTWIFPGVNY